jgi:hypothetical protein
VAGTRLKVIRIIKQDRDYYLTRGGIHGSELDEKRSSTDEYDTNLEHLLVHLAKIGPLKHAGECDYYVDRYATPDFFPCIEVSNENILSPRLICLVHAAVSQMEPDYRVDICNAWVYLNDPAFNIFIEHNVIYAYANREVALTSMGLDGEFFDTGTDLNLK